MTIEEMRADDGPDLGDKRAEAQPAPKLKPADRWESPLIHAPAAEERRGAASQEHLSAFVQAVMNDGGGGEEFGGGSLIAAKHHDVVLPSSSDSDRREYSERIAGPRALDHLAAVYTLSGGSVRAVERGGTEVGAARATLAL